MSFSRHVSSIAMRPFQRPARFLLLALALSSCASSGHKAGEALLRDYIWRSDFEPAVTLANELLEQHPDDQVVRDLYDVSYVGYFLDKGRDATLADSDLEALAWFKKAEEIRPDSVRVGWWQQKTKDKLADRHLSIGNEAYAREDYESAADAYRLILSLMPEHEGARAALHQVERVLAYREGLGAEYYVDGVRSFADCRLRAAAREFSVTNKYLPDQERARNRVQHAEELLAAERVGTALHFEEEGLYAAAHNEFRFALELDPGNEDALAGLDRLADEAQAARLLRDARMSIFRGDFEKALAFLEEGQVLTRLQGADFDLAREAIKESRLQRIYQKAWDLEHDGSYPQAIEVYGELLAATEFYKDAVARKDTLEGYVEIAAGYYQKAEDAEDDALELEHLRAIQGFWPGYRDIEGRIKRLEH